MKNFLVKGLPLLVVMWSTVAFAESATADETAALSSESQNNPEVITPEVITSDASGHTTGDVTPVSAITNETADEIAGETVASEAPLSADSDLPAPTSVMSSDTGESTTAVDLMPLFSDNSPSNPEADVTTAQATSEETEETEGTESVDNAAPSSDGVLRFTVTGTRNRLPVNELPATVTVFEVEDWDFYNVQGLEDLFRYEPGVSVDGSLTRYGVQDVNIRGIEGNRILFQVDNIRLPEQFTFGGLPPNGFRVGRGDYVDFATLQAVEVLRGPASTLYGSDALGGVVSFRSLRPSDLLEDDENFAGDFSTRYRSASGGFDNIGRFAARLDNLSGVFVISRRDARENDSFGEDEFTNGVSIGDTNLFGNLVYELTDNSQVNLIIEDINRQSDYSIASGNRAFSARVPSLTQLRSEGENRIERTRVSLAYEFDNPESESFLQFARAQVYYQSADTIEEVSEIRPAGSGALRGEAVRRDSFNEFVADSYGADLQFRSDFATGDVEHRLTYGIDFSNTENSRPRDRTQTGLVSGITTNNFGVAGIFPESDFADGETVRLGIYVQDEISIGDFDIIAGLRFDHYDLDTSNSDEFNGEAVDLTRSAVSPRVAVLYNATPEISIYGQYARGFRAPLYSEITSGFKNFAFGYETISSPDLQPETSNSFELGVRGNFPQFNFGITGFYNTYDNFIATGQLVGFRQLGPDRSIQQFQTINIDGARIYGVELSGEYRFSPEPHGFSILGSLAYAVGDDLEEDEPLNTVDPLRAVLGLRYRSPGDVWRAELIGTFAGVARVPDDSDQFVPDGYAVLDLVGNYNPTPDFGINLGIYNIFNSEYYQYSEVRNIGVQKGDDGISQYTQPGINVRLGFNLKF